jgi:hypothetical protein
LPAIAFVWNIESTDNTKPSGKILPHIFSRWSSAIALFTNNNTADDCV